MKKFFCSSPKAKEPGFGDLGRTGSLLDYMHSSPAEATYLPDLYRLPYPVEDLDEDIAG